MAAAFLRRLHDSSHGEVPIVKPCEEDTTEWKVWNMGREMSADWCVIQKCLTDSYELTKMMRCGGFVLVFFGIVLAGFLSQDRSLTR